MESMASRRQSGTMAALRRSPRLAGLDASEVSYPLPWQRPRKMARVEPKATKTATEPATQLTTQPATKPVSKKATQPATKPVIKPATKKLRRWKSGVFTEGAGEDIDHGDDILFVDVIGDAWCIDLAAHGVDFDTPGDTPAGTGDNPPGASKDSDLDAPRSGDEEHIFVHHRRSRGASQRTGPPDGTPLGFKR